MDKLITGLLNVIFLSIALGHFGDHQRFARRQAYLALAVKPGSDLRHSYAQNFLKRGGELKQLKTILGVRSLQAAEVVHGVHLDTLTPFF